MRRLLFALLILQASCKQACGLELIADTGGSGPGAGGSGAGGSGAGGGGGSGGMPCEGTQPVSLMVSTGLCIDAPAVLFCDEFNGPTNLLTPDPGAAGVTGSFQQDGDSGVLTITNGTGFWDGDPLAYYLHYPEVAGSFFVSTAVRPRGDGSGWPSDDAQLDPHLAGLVIRDGTCTSSFCAQWLKAEAGTLTPLAGGGTFRGLRIAEHDTSNGDDAPNGSDVHDVEMVEWNDYCEAPWVHIAICALWDEGTRTYTLTTSYREVGDPAVPPMAWTLAAPAMTLTMPASPGAGTMDVGIVGSGTDISADFGYLNVVPVTPAFDCGGALYAAYQSTEGM